MKKAIIFLLIVISFELFAEQPYVILISFDGFRWDYPDRGISPELKKMEERGVRAISFRPAFPSKTFPNHYSIITGMFPENHGIIMNYFRNPNTGEVYRLGDTVSVRDGKWYQGEAFWETARRNGIKTASYFWPGSEVKQEERRPDYFEKYEHKRAYRQRVDGVIEWLKLPWNERPKFITLYFDATDSYGHKYGPESEETNFAIRQLDSLVGYLKNGLAATSVADSVNIIIVSDHGMTEVSDEKTIRIDKILEDYKYEYTGGGPLLMIGAKENELDEIFNLLHLKEEHYRTYRKKNLPEWFNFSAHPFISPIILIADIGWSVEAGEKRYSSLGNHGYEKDHIDMHGIFFAEGPSFRKGFKTGTLWNVDVYPLLCEIYGISPRSNIDGSLERIGFILNER